MPNLYKGKFTFFVTYDGMIKDFQTTILDILKLDIMKEKFNDIINIDLLQTLSTKEIERLCVSCPYENILCSIGLKKDTNYGLLLYDLFVEFPDLFKETKLLSMGTSIHRLLNEGFLNNLYVYTPKYDERIYEDLKYEYHSSQVIYVYGDFVDTLKTITEKINTFAINNVSYLYPIINENRIYHSEVIIGNYGYNYDVDSEGNTTFKIKNIEDLQKQHVFKSALYNPYPHTTIK